MDASFERPIGRFRDGQELNAVAELLRGDHGYGNRLAIWAYPAIGDLPWTAVTREQIGAVLVKLAPPAAPRLASSRPAVR